MIKSSHRAVGAGLVLSLATALLAFGVSVQTPSAAAVEQPPTTMNLAAAQVPATKIAADSTVAIATAVKPKLSTITVTRTKSTANANTTSGTSGSTQTSTRAAKTVRRASTTSELSQARSILTGLIARYPIIKGATVTMGSTPSNYQAVCYYKSGHIVLNPNHTASLSTILNHEVWHIIDWRDNGRIDWGENIPR